MAKFSLYAVRRGHVTGIFTDWPSCSSTVRGFPGAEYKGFVSRLEAEAYLRGAAGPGRFYAIVRGHSTGVFWGVWSQFQPLVQGYPGALYTGFNTREEAEEWFYSGGSSISMMGGSSHHSILGGWLITNP